MSIKPKINLKSVVGPRTKVVLWVTEDSLSEDNDIYHDLNYLFDGMLSKNFDVFDKEATSLFSTKGFGKMLYLFRVHPNGINSIIEEVRKKVEGGINSHALLVVDTKLESSFYKITKEFEHISNLEVHLSKDMIEGH